MNVIEFGQENKDIILLLHGGGLSWWNYDEVAELLQNDYHIVLPILDGHSESDREFTSIEENASEIIQYIDEHFYGKVLLIGGLSLGGQIATEILSQRKDICQYAVIESALVLPMKFTHYLVKPMLEMSFGLIQKPWFSKLQFKSLRLKPRLFDKYFRDTCRITKENMISILKANSWYTLKQSLQHTEAKVYIYVGQREQRKMLLSAEIIHNTIPGSTLDVKKNLYHGDFSINHADKYATKLKEIVNLRSEPGESFMNINYSKATEDKIPLKTTYRAIDIESASGQSVKNVLNKEVRFYIDYVESGDEDFLILKSHDGFLQFYGVDNQFVAEMRINYPNGDFKTYSFINPEKGNALNRVTLETPYGHYTPTEREIISYNQLCLTVDNYYKYPDSKDFIRNVSCIDTTEETKKYMGL